MGIPEAARSYQKLLAIDGTSFKGSFPDHVGNLIGAYLYDGELPSNASDLKAKDIAEIFRNLYSLQDSPKRCLDHFIIAYEGGLKDYCPDSNQLIERYNAIYAIFNRYHKYLKDDLYHAEKIFDLESPILLRVLFDNQTSYYEDSTLFGHAVNKSCSLRDLEMLQALFKYRNRFKNGLRLFNGLLRHALALSQPPPQGHKEEGERIFTWLVENKLGINASGVGGNTPFHIAQSSNFSVPQRLDICSRLITAKADINALNSAGETPLYTHVECTLKQGFDYSDKLTELLMITGARNSSILEPIGVKVKDLPFPEGPYENWNSAFPQKGICEIAIEMAKLISKYEKLKRTPNEEVTVLTSTDE